MQQASAKLPAELDFLMMKNVLKPLGSVLGGEAAVRGPQDDPERS